MEYEEKLGKYVSILSRNIKRILNEEVSKYDITYEQTIFLKYIADNSLKCKVYAKDLENEFDKRKSTVAGIIQLLEQKGLIKRESLCDDNRYKELVLTKKAEKLLVQVNKTILNMDYNLLKDVSEKEYKLFIEIINKILKNINERSKN